MCLFVFAVDCRTYMNVIMYNFLSLYANKASCKYVLLSHHGQLCYFCFPSFEFMGLHLCATPVSRWNCKMQELYFFWYKGILPTRIQEGWGRCMKMHAHMLFTSASHPASPLTFHIQTPGIWNEMAWSWVWAAVIGRQKPAMLSEAKCCQKAIMEDGYMLSLPAFCPINID